MVTIGRVVVTIEASIGKSSKAENKYPPDWKPEQRGNKEKSSAYRGGHMLLFAEDGKYQNAAAAPLSYETWWRNSWKLLKLPICR